MTETTFIDSLLNEYLSTPNMDTNVTDGTVHMPLMDYRSTINESHADNNYLAFENFMELLDSNINNGILTHKQVDEAICAVIHGPAREIS